MQSTLRHFSVMPIDRSEIKTRLRIHPDIFDNPIDFIKSKRLEVRSSKPTPGKNMHGPTRKVVLDILQYKGIQVELTKPDSLPLTEAKIHFNPGVCLYGHNGRTPTLREFLDALALLVTNLKPLLENPNDWVHLVPGVVSGGHAYWSYIEVPFQCLDPDGELLSRFRHLSHKTIKSLPRHWPTSIKVGVPRGALKLNIYLKSKEMQAKGKLEPAHADDYSDILRFELKMREDKIAAYLDNERNTEVIDGKERVVRFYPYDLIQAHRKCFVDEILGVYSAPSPDVKVTPTQVEGRLLADTALDPRSHYSFPQLLANLRFYTGVDSDAMASRRKAGLAELSRRSTIKAADIFSDETYQAAYGITNEEIEKKLLYDSHDATANPQIIAAYRPDDGTFTPLTQWPTYLKA